jgi:Cu(I)/Ag(I) efflux system membrane protein CusA/SilA
VNVGARQGQYVTPTTELYFIADLSQVWVFVDVFEEELPWVSVGDTAEMRVEGVPGKTFTGQLTYIYPYAERKTRTIKARLEFPNEDQQLKPDMFADVRIRAQPKENVIAVPSEAIVRSGLSEKVFIVKGKGKFEPREVTVGVSSEGWTEVLTGLETGEQVVVSAQFLIDSESKLREAAIEASLANRFLIIVGTLFLIGAGLWAVRTTPLDAIPDLSDVQVIVFTEYPGQAPQVVEDQVTYPLTTAMLAVPRAMDVRGFSFFGLSFVYIIFEDGTDLYWARSRVLEYLNYVSGRLPSGVNPTLGPDATGVGWIYEYALVDPTGGHDLAELRSIQDWYLRYPLQTVPGVAEVASVGGYVKQYQVEVDPNALANYSIPLSAVRHAIMRSNRDVGGGLIEMSETEYMVRGLGYIKSISDIEQIAVRVDDRGTPIRIKDIARVQSGPELRRGVAELNGEGEVAGGVVIMRYGENALSTIEGVRQKLAELSTGLPEGVEIVPVYDRGALIDRAVDNLTMTLILEFVLVALVCAVFLLHLRSALVAIIALPIGILMAFIAMKFQGINANIMSLGGIAIAIGAMVDGPIVLIENAHKHLAMARDKFGDVLSPQERWAAIGTAAKEVGPALFFSLLVIVVSYFAIFTLEAQEGRLFKPSCLYRC